jgi:hypothetical protein
MSTLTNGSISGHSGSSTHATMSVSNIRSADMFLIRGLEKMLAEKEIRKKESAELKKQCELLLSKLMNPFERLSQIKSFSILIFY